MNPFRFAADMHNSCRIYIPNLITIFRILRHRSGLRLEEKGFVKPACGLDQFGASYDAGTEDGGDVSREP